MEKTRGGTNLRRVRAMAVRIAIVGGGITGAVAASVIASEHPEVTVEVFDQGRRGPGGRASHRAVAPDGTGSGAVLPDDGPVDFSALHFDHGCQFMRADDPSMRALVARWCANGWAAKWAGRFGHANRGGGACDGGGGADFFGLPTLQTPVYVGMGGMHTLPRRILSDSTAVVHGKRVSGLHHTDGGKWELLGVSGPAAFHDTAEAVAARAKHDVLGQYDAVLLTGACQTFSSATNSLRLCALSLPFRLMASNSMRVRVPAFPLPHRRLVVLFWMAPCERWPPRGNWRPGARASACATLLGHGGLRVTSRAFSRRDRLRCGGCEEQGRRGWRGRRGRRGQRGRGRGRRQGCEGFTPRGVVRCHEMG